MYAASVYSTAQTTKAGGKPLSAFEEEIFESDGLEQQGKSSRVGSRNSRDVDSQQSD